MKGYFRRLRKREVDPGDEYISIMIIALAAFAVGVIIFSISQ